MTTTLIVGCGYVGQRIAQILIQSGHSISAITKQPSNAALLATYGITASVFDLDSSPVSHFPIPDKPYRLIYTVPPPKTGHTDIRVLRLQQILQDNPPIHTVYLSTSGVYGDCHGQWVNEDTSPNPGTLRAIRRLDAERSFEDWCEKLDCSRTLLRIAGIYGSDRLPINKIKQGMPVVIEKEASWSNRIHIDDLTTICVSALGQIGHNQLFNVADDTPTSTTTFIYAVADAYNLTRPPAITLSTALKNATTRKYAYLFESRRINNKRVKSSLNISLKYPDCLSYLADIKHRD